jgi:hypothetical protein
LPPPPDRAAPLSLLPPRRPAGGVPGVDMTARRA